MGTNNIEIDPVKEKVKNYWSSSSKYYDQSPGLNSEEEKSCWKKELGKVIGEEKKDILDVGTGTGFIASLLAELGHNVTGVDFSKDMLAVAEEKTKRLNLSIKLMECDAENLPFDENTFDCVICRYLLWTLPNPEKAIMGWIKATKPGGKIIIIDGEWAPKSAAQKLSRKMLALDQFLRYGANFSKTHYSKSLREKIPNRDGVSSKKIVEYLSEFEVKDIKIIDLRHIRKVQKKHLSWHLRYSYDRPTHLVYGTVK